MNSKPERQRRALRGMIADADEELRRIRAYLARGIKKIGDIRPTLARAAGHLDKEHER